MHSAELVRPTADSEVAPSSSLALRNIVGSIAVEGAELSDDVGWSTAPLKIMLPYSANGDAQVCLIVRATRCAIGSTKNLDNLLLAVFVEKMDTGLPWQRTHAALQQHNRFCLLL